MTAGARPARARAWPRPAAFHSKAHRLLGPRHVRHRDLARPLRPPLQEPLQLASVGQGLGAALPEGPQVFDDPLGQLVLVVAAAQLTRAAGAVYLSNPLRRRAEQLLVAEHVADLG